MSDRWYTRPILYVADMDRALAHYTGALGFTVSWRYDDDGRTAVAQVERAGCELILSCQESMKAGPGRIFVSLDAEVLDAVRREFEGKGVAVREERWGYRTMVVADPDGNELFFPYPREE